MTNNNFAIKENTMVVNDAPLKIIYELDFGTQVGMVRLRDGNLRCSIGIIVISLDGQVSDMIQLKRSKIITGKNSFNFLYDFGDFSRDDILAVHNRVLEELRKETKHTIYARNFASWEYMYKLIIDYVANNNIPDFVEKDNTYMYIETNAFEQMINEISEENYIECKKKDLLNLFLACGILQPNKNVPYLYKKKMSEKEGYVYVYRLKHIDEFSSFEEEA